MKYIFRLFLWIKPKIIFYMIGISLLISVDIIQIFIPKLIGELVDALKILKLNHYDIIIFILKILGLSLIIFLIRILWRLFIMKPARDIEYNMRNRLFEHLELLSQNFYNKNKIGDLMAYFTNDLGAIRMMLGSGVLFLGDAIFLTIFVITNMLLVDIKLTIISILPFPILAISGYFLGKILDIRYEDKQKAFARLSSFTQEVFSGIKIIKAFVQEHYEIKKFYQENKHNKEKNIKLIKIFLLLFPLFEIITGISYLIALLYGGYLTIIGDITLGLFVAFNQYIAILSWPMIAFGWSLNIISQGFASFKRVTTLLEEKIEISDYYNPIELNSDLKENLNIKIVNLNFSYESSNYQILKNINLEIKKGELFGITGKTGSGKSTLVNLLLRIYEPEDNTIFINNIDLKKIKLKDLRDIITLVPQENYLFSDSIKNNINLFEKDINLEKIKKIAFFASLDNNIENFKNKYETIIGEKGITISGGQKQRISIARAILRDTLVIIFDDSFSSLDNETEKEILNNIINFKKNKIIIIISHRLSTLINCDRIAYFEDGEIKEIGSHKELLKLKGCYYKLHEREHIEKKLLEEKI